MKQYLEALRHVLENGEEVGDRTGIGTKSVFGYQMRFDLRRGFPAVTTKKLAFKACLSELLWFISGSGNERDLAEILHGSRDPDLQTIWTANYENQAKALGYTEGHLGPVYGVQWRSFCGGEVAQEVDQLGKVIWQLKNEPDSRRIILSAWNPTEIDDMALPPCHCFVQFKVTKGRLSCQLYQRSADMFLGVPFNIASYSLLTHMLAQVCDLEVGEFIWSGGDCHIYLNHLEQVKEQLSREPQALPALIMNPEIKDIEEFSMDDFQLDGYTPMKSIKAEMAV